MIVLTGGSRAVNGVIQLIVVIIMFLFVLALAYLSAMQYYFKPVREMPTGRGFADFVFLPMPEYRMDYPALVVELKWNKSDKTALDQIKEKKYPSSILSYTGDILMVGINYDKKNKVHQCQIEKYVK